MAVFSRSHLYICKRSLSCMFGNVRLVRVRLAMVLRTAFQKIAFIPELVGWELLESIENFRDRSTRSCSVLILAWTIAKGNALLEFKPFVSSLR